MTTDYLAIVREAWERQLRSERGDRKPAPRSYVYASGRRACVRWMALDVTTPVAEEFTADGLERMRKGQDREAQIMGRLYSVGMLSTPQFDVSGGQEVMEIADEEGPLIRGKIDGRLSFRGLPGRPVLECKAGRSFEGIESFEDFSRSRWTRHAPDQMLAYLLADELSGNAARGEGFFILDRPGVPVFVPIRLEEHRARAEAFVAEAKLVREAAKGGPLPDFTTNPANCKVCPHYAKNCFPTDLAAGGETKIFTDPELISDAELVVSLAPVAKEYAAAKDRLTGDTKKPGPLRGVEHALVGPFEVTGKFSASSRVELPEDIRKRYTIKDPRGKFSLHIERLAAADADEQKEAP